MLRVCPCGLLNNGGGFIYDTDLDITWYDYTYKGPQGDGATWDQATAWEAGLTAGGVSGWSLPGTAGTSFNYTNEGAMGYLYYNDMRNTEGGPLADKGPFANLEAFYYWSGARYVDPMFAWTFSFRYGSQNPGYVPNLNYALAVHPGDMGAPTHSAGAGGPVPVPAAILLLTPGLAGFAAIRRRLGK